MKLLAPILLIAAVGCLALDRVNPGSGWYVAAIGFGGIGAFVAIYSKVRTGKWFTNDAGGH